MALIRDSNDPDGIVHLIRKHAADMVRQGRTRPLQTWLGCLPKDVMENDPWLLYWMGACRLPFTPSQRRACFEKAFELFKNREDVGGIFLAWAGVVDSILSAFEDYKRLDRGISILDQMSDDFRAYPSDPIEAVVTSGMFQALVRRQPHHQNIEAWADQALSSAQAQGDITVRLPTLIRLALHCMYIGETQKTLLAINQIRQLSQSPDLSPFALLIARFAEVMDCNLSEAPLEKCPKAVSDALELAQTTGIHKLDPRLLGQGAMNLLNAGDYYAVEKFLDRMALGIKSFKPWDACFYHLLKARAGLLAQNPRQASLHAETALKLSEDGGSPISSVRYHLASAHAMNELGKHREAADHLASALTISRQIRAKNTEFYALLAEALFALDQGKETSALSPLAKALASIGVDPRAVFPLEGRETGPVLPQGPIKAYNGAKSNNRFRREKG